jgi:pimeloyl-ACP methyl ester carboxylesterase
VRKGDIRLRSADGTRLAAHVYGRGPTAVVLAHMRPGNLCQWTSYAKRLSKRGYRVLAFDFRNYGASQKRTTKSTGYAQDVAAGVRYLRSHRATKVFLVGASFGGSSVVTAGADVQPQVDGVVSVSGAADLVGAIDAAPRLRAPALFMVGRFDAGFFEDAQRLYDAAGSADKSLQILKRGEHGVPLVEVSPAARALIERFLASH